MTVVSDLARFAGASPHALLFDRRFWRKNVRVAATMLACVLALVILAPLAYPRSDDPGVWLTVLIHSLLLGGFWATCVALAEVEVNEALARIVDQRCAEQLGRIKGRQQERVTLEQLEDELLPHNPACAVGVLRIFQHILHEARDRKFESVFALMQPLREDTLGQLSRIQTIQRIAVQLGVLGTFAGLVLALSSLSGGARSLLEPAAIRELCGALYMSFCTSVAGLEVAIALALLSVFLRRRQEAFIRHAESAVATLSSLARNAINRDDFLVEFEQVRNAVLQVTDRVAAQTGEIEAQTLAIQAGLDRLGALRADFDRFLDGIRQEQAAALKEVRSVYELMSPRHVADGVHAGLASAVDDLGARLAPHWRELERVSADLRVLRELGQTLHAQADVHGRALETTRSALTELLSSVERASGAHAGVGSLHAGRQLQSQGQSPAATASTATRDLTAQIDRLCAEIGRNTFMLGSLAAAQTTAPSLVTRVGRRFHENMVAAGRRVDAWTARLPVPWRSLPGQRPGEGSNTPADERSVAHQP